MKISKKVSALVLIIVILTTIAFGSFADVQDLKPRTSTSIQKLVV